MSSEQARTVIGDLEDKLAAASATEIELATDARRISYSALSDGDEGARKALAKIDGDEVKLRQTQKHLRDALAEAKRRLAESERAEERERLAENAEKANAIGERLVERARKIDEAFAVISEESNAFMSDITALAPLGLSNPRVEQYRVLGAIAANTALMFTPLKIQHMAPRERRSFSELAAGWRAQIAHWAAQFTDKSQEAA
jgi:hypothetical protein